MTHARIPHFGRPAPTARLARAVAAKQPHPAIVLTAHAFRLTGELLTALTLIAGGAVLVGLATLL